MVKISTFSIDFNQITSFTYLWRTMYLYSLDELKISAESIHEFMNCYFMNIINDPYKLQSCNFYFNINLHKLHFGKTFEELQKKFHCKGIHHTPFTYHGPQQAYFTEFFCHGLEILEFI